jgi:hypothetical protein
VTERTFDRLPEEDPRSKRYPIRAILPEKKPRSYTWRHVQLDQGSEGACVGFACVMEAAARPVPVWGDPVKNPPNISTVNSIARDHYHQAQDIDQYPPGTEGTSVLAGMKIGVANNYWQEYRWATGTPAQQATDVILALGYHGPVVIGANWWSNMDEPDADGFLRPSGFIRGGHAFLLAAYNVGRDAVWTPNSWGGAGQGWISRTSLMKLLKEDGEAAVPVVREHG